MRRFLHRKGQLPRQDVMANANGGQYTTRGSALAGLLQGPSPTGRVRAPNLRSRSMSVLTGPESPVVRSKKFTRSLSFCMDDQQGINNQNFAQKALTQTEEDEVFQTYTKKVYFTVAALCAVVTSFIIYAYIYNTAGKGT